MIIVTPGNFDECVQAISTEAVNACDCETTGLFPWKKDDLFSIQFSTADKDYYFNFIEYDPPVDVLPVSAIQKLQVCFTGKRVFLQNAKFDMAFLWKHGVRFDGCDIHDTEVVGRIIRNDHLKYSLDEQCKRELGQAKDDTVMEWLKKNKKFKAVQIPGKDTVYKAYHFDEVPFEMITKYGCWDTRLTYTLGMKQVSQIEALIKEASTYEQSVGPVYELEKELTHVCFDIERVGIQIDKEYCEKAVEYESARVQDSESRFLNYSSTPIVDSGKCLGPIFENLGFKPGRTEGDEYEVTDTFLGTIEHPLAKIVQDYRDARKRVNTYFRSYLYYADPQGVLHANMKQTGTKTGRFAYMDPNLQNIHGDDPESDDANNSPFPIRRAFFPREGFFFVSIDYRQMEFRMMLDEAGQRDLIEKIKAGHDPHDATAELTGLKRKPAKTLNFGLLYGMGLDKLGAAIGVVREVAQSFKKQYFAALPMVENYIIMCSGAVKTRSARDPGNGWIKTWFGRRSYFDDPKWAYRAANAKIQGGCADVVKIAMVKLWKLLSPYKSRMVLQVHDELLFEIAFDEVDQVGPILGIMETVYPHQHLPLTCSVAYSLKSFYDLIERDRRLDFVKETGNFVEGKGDAKASPASQHVAGQDSTTHH